MGSIEEETYDSEHDAFNVLVTGFGEFRDFENGNPAWLIAKSLPPFLPALSGSRRKINVAVPSNPLQVAYSAVEEFENGIFADREQSPFDVYIHIGVASGLEGFKIECLARRDKYPFKDVTGELPKPSYLEDRQKFPEVIHTTANLRDVFERWDREVPHAKLAVSRDAGLYLCEYIYYATLSRTYEWRDSTIVLFLHVPPPTSPEAIELGRDVAVGLIRAVVDSKSSSAQQAMAGNKEATV